VPVGPKVAPRADDGHSVEAAQWSDIRAQRMAQFVERDRANEGQFVLRATPQGTAGRFTAERVGAVDMQGSREAE
jgi:hypothetical protein